MKKIIGFFTLTLLLTRLNGQTSTENYVITTTPVTEISDAQLIPTMGNTQKRTQVIYYDGLGRPLQEIAHRQGPSFEDMIQIYEYDMHGREVKKHLPYGGASPSLNFRTNAFTEQKDFYQKKARVSHTQYPFSEAQFEESPFDRVLEQGSAGVDWQVGGETIEISYEVNGPSEVRLWVMNSGQWVSNSFYASGELYRHITRDEHGMKTVVYNDKESRTVLRKQQFGSNPERFTETYYVYDDLGLLRCVIPPQAYADMISYNVNIEVPDRVYLYNYDERKRVVEKKIPHKGWEYIVYDDLDRPVATQDAVQRASWQWTFTKYDVLGRIIMTGLKVRSGESRATLQQNIYSWIAVGVKRYEERTNSTAYFGYTSLAWPTNMDEVLTVNYYDDYDFNNDGSPDVNFASPPTGFTVSSPTARTRSLPTGNLVQVLDGTGNTFLQSVNWYDEKGRVIQSRTQNHLGGVDRTFNEYNFIGELLRTRTEHGFGGQGHYFEKRFTYDHAGRLLKTYQSIDGQDEIILSSQSYNALGQLTEKDLHGVPYSGTTIPPGWNQTYLQSVDYAYNIRGWLTHINNADLKDDAYNDASASTGGFISGYDFYGLSYKVVEIYDNETPSHLELWVQDESEMLVQGNLTTAHYDNEEAARMFLREYSAEDAVYTTLNSIANVVFTNSYQQARTVNSNTEISALEEWLYPEVADDLQAQEVFDETAIGAVQQSVFNYVAGKAGHIMEADSVAFADQKLYLTYLEKNGYQLFMKVKGENQEEAEIFIMDHTPSNQEEYNHLLALTDNGEGGYNPLLVNFGTVTLTENMGTVEAMLACQDYVTAELVNNNITNVATKDALDRFAAAYAADDYGNVYFNNDENDLWGMELKYNSKSSQLGNNEPLQSTQLYNGNIAEMHWKSGSDNIRRAYGYQYDGLNRLTAATFKAFNYSNELWDKEVNRYSVNGISYDLNGNIGTLNRRGLTGTISTPAFGVMDDIIYAYSGDQLINVTDEEIGSHPLDFADGNLHYTTGLDDYTYDNNGNLTKDRNKGITGITYNHLNLPQEVSKGATHKVEYLYDATGAKLQKTVTDGSTVTVTDYASIGNYTNGTLDFIFTGEGRAVDDNGSWRYEYYYKDHLGNTRLGFSDYDGNEEVDETEITQQNNYYPFGLEHKGTDYGIATQTTHKYLFQKQELQDELGLGWYSFRWRNSMPELGRFFNVDPLADKYVYNSVYAFSENRVTDGIELEGLEHLSIKRVAQTNGGFQTTITPQSNQELGDWHNSPLQIQYQNYDANNNLVSKRTEGEFLYPYERQMVQEKYRLHPHRNGFVDRNNPGRIGSIQFTTANQSSTTSSSTSSTITPVINFVPGRATLAPSTSPNIFSNLVGLAPNSITSSTSGNITTTISSSSTIGISIRSTLKLEFNSTLFSNRFSTLSSGLISAGFPSRNVINNGVVDRLTLASMGGSVNQVNFNINTTTQTTMSSTRQILQNVRLIGNGTPDTN